MTPELQHQVDRARTGRAIRWLVAYLGSSLLFIGLIGTSSTATYTQPAHPYSSLLTTLCRSLPQEMVLLRCVFKAPTLTLTVHAASQREQAQLEGLFAEAGIPSYKLLSCEQDVCGWRCRYRCRVADNSCVS